MGTISGSDAAGVSAAGVAMIKQFEGLAVAPKALQPGRWAVGYSHIITGDDAPSSVTEDQAHALLMADLAAVDAEIAAAVFAPLTQNQRDALASFAFNVGPEAFSRSDVVAALNRGRPADAAAAMMGWTSARWRGRLTPMAALTARRAVEAAHFWGGADAVSAPSAQLTGQRTALVDASAGARVVGKARQGLGRAAAKGMTAAHNRLSQARQFAGEPKARTLAAAWGPVLGLIAGLALVIAAVSAVRQTPDAAGWRALGVVGGVLAVAGGYGLVRWWFGRGAQRAATPDTARLARFAPGNWLRRNSGVETTQAE